MEPIVDKHGKEVGWLDEQTVLDLNMVERVWLKQTSVVTKGGRRIGEFDGTFFFDNAGVPVGFVRPADANEGVIVPEIIPVPFGGSVFCFPEGPTGVSVVRVWSRLSWDQFLAQAGHE